MLEFYDRGLKNGEYCWVKDIIVPGLKMSELHMSYWLSVHTVVNEAYANDITIMLMGKMQNGQDQTADIQYVHIFLD